MNKANPVNLAVVAATNTVKAGLPRALDIGTEGPFSISNSEIANYINPGLLVGRKVGDLVRGTLLMALSNKTGAIVVTTGNKSEMATGYCTLYGDMAGGFAVIKDLAKTLVYRLSRWRNAQAAAAGQVEPIPDRIITRPPSAELRPDQKDQDRLPPYDILDAIVEAYVEQDKSPRDIIAAGYPRADVERVVRLIKVTEYKRRQAPVGIRVTSRGYGKDWRYPITNKFRPRFD